MWVKICGVGSSPAAQAAAEVGADAVGLNFYPPSPRSVSVETAQHIVGQLPDDITPVGLFVNQKPEEIAEICRRTGIQHIQLHGDETPADIAVLQSLLPEAYFLRAFRLGEEEPDLNEISDYLSECLCLGVSLWACLLDARVPGHYGGTGQKAPWELISRAYRSEDWPPLILAGGLTPANVSEAVRSVCPWGVDVAGGVESAPGQKDPRAMERFVRAARQAAGDAKT